MPDLSGLPALSVNPVGFGATANEAAAQSGLAQLNLQRQQTLQPLELEQQSQLIPLATEAKKREAMLAQTQAGNDMIAQAAKDAQAADPADAPSVWDAGMQKAADAGHPAARQFIGHYYPAKADQISAVYGAPAAGESGSQSANSQAPAGPDPKMLDMQISQLPPQQIAQSLGNMNRAISSFNNVKDKESWDAEIQTLRQNGIPIDKLLPNTEWNPLNYASAARLIKNMTPIRDAMERATTRMQSGLGVPIPRNIIKTDAGIYEVNPYAPPGTPAVNLASTPSYARTNQTDAQGRPILVDAHTGKTIAGDPVDPNAPPAVPVTTWAGQMNQAENATGDRTAQNPRSTATGNGQFTDSTWLQTAKASLPDVVQGMNDQQILQMRRDPAFSQEMTAAYAKANGAKLVADGQPVNGTTLALAHRFGPDGASKILDAPPDAKMEDIVSPEVLKANPELKGQTAGGYARSIAAQFGVQPVDIGIPTPGNSPRTLSPEERELQTKQLPAQFEKAEESYQSAQNLKLQLANMQDQLNQMGTSGFLTPGTGDTSRLAFAKRINSLASAAGMSDDYIKRNLFDPNKVASGEDIVKGTTRLGFDLARQLGSREAMMIVQQAVGAVPGLENTPRGARLIFGALNTAAQRQSDYYEYLQNWAQTHANTMGADVAFNKAYPVQHYTNMALLAGVPQSRVQYLKANPKAAKDFDAYYGKGLSSVILGDK
jgi:hypothetical protein